ncbi:hypothetical protein HC356_04475 [Wolbachia pipientis]|uniref:Uncharacterized protein n=1 Tax=Wolbachia pipientis TaxID=955 RepID=A0A7G5CE80_WOLPI|nr:hypothetical protein HC356_01540 [Wolbachia pipientis]QMV47509.1 hypothetical protein HC356_01730 [Wolbachia pipientis]QMV47514.1 hypothetical protein HC356_01920 [Wolbachia pipientis]QMV47565.1 hypothetical protein HC356_04475 [Wolbachia pipientis]
MHDKNSWIPVSRTGMTGE